MVVRPQSAGYLFFDSLIDLRNLGTSDRFGQGTIVLDGVPPAAVASLQGVGYLPVELAFSLGTDQSSGIR